MMSLRNKVMCGLAALLLLSLVVVNKFDCFPRRSGSIDISNALDKKNVVPLLIVGSGPAGLSAAIYGVRSNIQTLVMHGPLPGGLLMQTSLVENWPGNKSILGPDIIKNLQEHAAGIGERFVDNKIDAIEFLEDSIENMDLSTWPFKIQTESGITLYALSIIIATGAKPKMLGIPGEQEYWKAGVTTCAICDGPFYKGRDVVVIGGGDSAAEEAIQLARHAKSVTVMVRKESMRASSIMQARLKEYPTIKVMYNVEIQEIVGDGTHVKGIKVYNNKTNTVKTVLTDGVFLAIGHIPNSAIIQDQVKVDAEGYIAMNDRTQETSVPGVFAAGDVEDRRYRQAGVASGRGISAGLDAVEFLTSIGFNTAIAAKLENNLFRVKKAAAAELFTVKSAADFKNKVEDQQGLVVIECFMQECYFCKVMDPIFKTISGEYGDKATFVKLDIDAAPDLAEQLYISSAPTFMVYRDGKLAGRYNGAMSKEEFAAFIDKFLAPDVE